VELGVVTQKVIQDAIEKISKVAKGRANIECNGELPRLYFTGDQGLHATYLCARSLVIQGVGVKVFAVPGIFSLVRGGDEQEEWDNSPVIVVTGFIEGIGGPRLPGPEEEILAVQSFIRRSMDDGKCFIFQGEAIPDPKKTGTPGMFWGASLLREVAKTSTIITI
jgi:hypothetical protein